MVFIETSIFTKEIKRLLPDEEYRMLQTALMFRPDAGDIVAQQAIPIAYDDTAHSLFLKMVAAAPAVLRRVLPELKTGRFPRRPQEGPPSYFGGRRPEDGLIDWRRTADSIYNLVRATTHPYPGAFTFFNEKKLHVWRARPMDGGGGEAPGTVTSAAPLTVAAGRGRLELLSVQLEGEEETDGPGFSRTHNPEGSILGGNL